MDVVGGQVHALTRAQRKTSIGTRRFIKERVCARSCVYVCVCGILLISGWLVIVYGQIKLDVDCIQLRELLDHVT